MNAGLVNAGLVDLDRIDSIPADLGEVEGLNLAMLEREIEITNKLGLHARAAAKLVKAAGGFISSIEIENKDQRVNAKSIMSVMMLAASRGNTVKLYVDGDDQDTAMTTVVALIEDKFGEDE